MDTQTPTDPRDRATAGQDTGDVPARQSPVRTRHLLPKHTREMETCGHPPAGSHLPARTDSESPREGAAVTILLTYARDRFPRGEIVIRNLYRLDDDTVEQDRSRRVYPREQTHYFIAELWDLLYEHIAAADQVHPSSMVIRLEIPQQIGLIYRYTRAVAEVAAAEFGALVAGTAPDLAYAS